MVNEILTNIYNSNIHWNLIHAKTTDNQIIMHGFHNIWNDKK